MQPNHKQLPVVVAGGGLAGMAAALYLARAGQPVIVYEQAASLGGRARTQEKAGFHFNQGPHALYRAGAGAQVLAELGIAYTGQQPPKVGVAIHNDAVHPFPYTPLDVLTTSLFSWPEKATFALLAVRMGSGMRLDPSLSYTDWVASASNHQTVRDFLLASARVATYANDPQRASAAAVLEQMRLAITANVLYLDGGWQRLVDGLHRAGREAGVKFVTGKRIVALAQDAFGRVTGVHLSDGQEQEAASVLLTGSPQSVGEIVGQERMPATPPPVRAAVLDVALGRLPDPTKLFALSLNQPLYFSVHSTAAQLAPADGALIHVAKYLPTGESDAEADEKQLLALLDRMQPGWQAEVVERRFLPHLTVTNALVAAADGGLPGRIDVDGLGIPGLLMAGDWVGIGWGQRGCWPMPVWPAPHAQPNRSQRKPTPTRDKPEWITPLSFLRTDPIFSPLPIGCWAR